MNIIKADIFNKKELIIFSLVYIVLFVNALFTNDSIIALLNAFCGITYTILAGKGKPVCYLFGIAGSGFYCILAFISNLWGNLLLYACYYMPMQIIGYFRWNKNLKQDRKDIIKTYLSNKERIAVFIISTACSFCLIALLKHFGGKNPILDGITTVLSVAGMFLTVKRCIEQWIVWFIVNTLSLIMWLKIAISGEKVYSTVIMWAVYVILAVYFFFVWKKELKQIK